MVAKSRGAIVSTTPPPRRDTAVPALRLWTALAILYFAWGSTYLAIKLAIDSIPPLLMAGTRFLVAGGVLYAVAIRRGDVEGDRPGLPQWRAAAVVGGALLFVGNGGVVWAEHRDVPTGVVALIVATVPLWMALIDRVVNGQRLPGLVMFGLVLGFVGLALLVGRADGRIDPLGTSLVVVASLSWAAGSVYARRAPLPRRAFLAAGMEMLCGGVLLTLVGAASGEIADLDPGAITTRSALGLTYLIVIGSVVAFSAYAWLLGSARLSLVSTYAYVNPVVAVFLGWAVLSELVTGRTLVASAVILAAVALIVTARARPEPVPPPPADGPPFEPARTSAPGTPR
jgi:drug/metabolite transporter (DMT)-like permease